MDATKAKHEHATKSDAAQAARHDFDWRLWLLEVWPFDPDTWGTDCPQFIDTSGKLMKLRVPQAGSDSPCPSVFNGDNDARVTDSITPHITDRINRMKRMNRY